MDTPNEFSSRLLLSANSAAAQSLFARARRVAKTSLESSKGYDDAFRAVDVDVLVNGPGGEETRVTAFWAGGRTWQWRFSSSEPGVFRYLTEANNITNFGLHGVGTEAEGAKQQADVATMAGPGGLCIDDSDNIYLTATDEREVQRLSPGGELTTIARGFEADPEFRRRGFIQSQDGRCRGARSDRARGFNQHYLRPQGESMHAIFVEFGRGSRDRLFAQRWGHRG